MSALSIKHLTKTYDNGVQALKDISFEVKKGDFFALLGPNGAGKSTTIGVISTLVNKTKGNVQVFGYDLDKQPNHAKACIGIVPQEFNCNIFQSVNEVLVNQAGYYGILPSVAKQRAKKYLTELSLWDKRKTQVRHLSGGMKRRLMIARALINEPRLLVLDEPTAGVDIEIRHALWQYLQRLNREGTTIILTTHYLEEAESLCRNIAIINHGKIVRSDSMRKLLTEQRRQTFVIDVASPLIVLPKFANYTLQAVDEHAFEVSIDENQSLNELFSLLAEKNIKVLSMRNKMNRLEELFINLTKREN